STSPSRPAAWGEVLRRVRPEARGRPQGWGCSGPQSLAARDPSELGADFVAGLPAPGSPPAGSPSPWAVGSPTAVAVAARAAPVRVVRRVRLRCTADPHGRIARDGNSIVLRRPEAASPGRLTRRPQAARSPPRHRRPPCPAVATVTGLDGAARGRGSLAPGGSCAAAAPARPAPGLHPLPPGQLLRSSSTGMHKGLKPST